MNNNAHLCFSYSPDHKSILISTRNKNYADFLGNGFPLAAVVTTQAIANTLLNANHFNTFAGNPLSSAVGTAVLEVKKIGNKP